MPVVSAHKSDIGRKKNRNEDYVWVDDGLGLYILADGMGGQEAGEVASYLATVTISDRLSSQLQSETPTLSGEAAKDLIMEALEVANSTVFNEAKAAGHKRKMATTVVMALRQSSTFYISHAGDSRAYVVRGSGLKQLTEDDSWGVWNNSTERNRRSLIDHFLTKYVGQENNLEPSFVEVKLAPEDWLLLCSDGLWSKLDEAQILTELQKAENDPSRAVEALVLAANQAGGEDNISIIAIRNSPS